MNLPKKILAIAFFVMSGLASLFVSLDTSVYDIDQQSVLVAPDSAEVGELIRVHSGSELVKWMVIPEIIDYQEYGTGSMAISFRSPGTYILIASTYKGSNLTLAKHSIQVGPSSVPIPAPIPTPVPSVEPVVAVDTLTQLVSSWCDEAKVNSDIRKRLSENFATVGNSKSLNEVSALLKETAALNSLIPSGPHREVLGKIQAQLMKPPSPQTVADYREVWIQISNGFQG